MAIKTISQFDAATPTSNDKILFEQNGEGKSATLADLPISTKTQTALNAKVNTANVLTLEEIMASTDLTGKIANASALVQNISVIGFHNSGETLSIKVNRSCLVFINGADNNFYYVGTLLYGNALDRLISDGTYDSYISYNDHTHLVTFPTEEYYHYAIIY